ncbi:MAG: hypothetical protein CL605_02250 [Altibacter sp.]|uniref:hypothetical protein n=1 Tax=Altibacter sp. TaxID=2024823 RepID=UPI000C89ACC8|nr:hypothetical protein [Altibacter sp.]MAP53704.1 hypothetical protein [Altibacter sp.]|tara:strand:+ start:1283 stop:1507 length:225 start_codon:yes stop_codon:yes gene_type:complete
MVSVREIRRIVKEETGRGIKAEAVEELQVRCEQILKQLVRYTGVASGERNGPTTRISLADVRLGYLKMQDEVKE